MSWHDPNSRWQQKLRRRIRFLLFFCAGSLLLFVAITVMLWRIDASISSIGVSGISNKGFLFTPIVIVIAIAEFISLVPLARRIRVERIVLEKVPKCDGYLCPRCRTSLPERSSEGSCPNCLTPYTRSELQSYWVDYVFEPQRLRPWATKASWRQHIFNLKSWFQEHPLAFTVLNVIGVFAMLLPMSWVTGISFMGAVVRYLPLFLGISLIGTGIRYLQRYRKRTGQTRHCVSCGYQQSPQGENPEHCPECGADWRRPGGLISGAQSRKPEHLWLACGFLGISAVLLIMHTVSLYRGSNWTFRVLPTSTLIHDTTASGGSTQTEWKEILRRKLTPEQRLQLAVGLLDKRLRRNYGDSTEGGWLWKQVSTGTLPDDLIERYYREMLDVWIDAPETATVGKPFRVSIGSIYRYGEPPTGIDEVVYFGGFFVGEDTTPIARQEGEFPVIANLLNDHEYRIQTHITPVRVGFLRIRAVLYFAIGSKLVWPKPPVQWHDDETATLPPMVVWSRRIELEKTMETDK